MTSTKRVFRTLLRVFGWLIAAVVLLLLLIVIFIRTPWGQQIIVDKAVSFVAEKTSATIVIKRLYVTFRGDVYLEELYLEDERGDTLVYSHSLEAGVRLIPLITSGDIHVSRVLWDGLTAQVDRSETGRFNFDFLMEGFQSDSTQTTGDEPDSLAQQDGGFPNLAIGPVKLTNFDLSYTDEVMGIKADFKMGELAVDINSLSLDKMEFDIDRIVLADVDLNYLQTKPFEPSEEEDPSSLPAPAVILDQLSLERIKVDFQSEPDGIFAMVDLGAFGLSLQEVDLERNRILIPEVSLHRLKADILMQASEADVQISDNPVDELTGFAWPQWAVEIGSVDLAENTIRYRTDENVPQLGKFDPSHIAVENLRLQTGPITLGERSAGMQIAEISFAERSGFQLVQFGLRLSMDDREFSVNRIAVDTRHSKLRGEATISYADVESFIQDLQWSNVEVDLSLIDIGLADALYFSPELKTQPIFGTLAKRQLRGTFSARGSMDEIQQIDGRLAWGQDTRLTVRGAVQNPLDTENLVLRDLNLDLKTVRADLNLLQPETELGLVWPEEVALKAGVDGAVQDLTAEILLATNLGNVDADLQYRDGTVTGYEGTINFQQIELGTLLQNPQLGSLTAEFSLKGTGTELDSLTLEAASRFDQLELFGYDYAGLEIALNAENRKAGIEIFIDDENLELQISGSADLSNEDPKVDLLINLNGADFRQLNLTADDMRARLVYGIHWEGNPDQFSLHTELREGVLVYEETSYPIEVFDILAWVAPDTTYAQLESNVIEADFASNAAPDRTIEALTYYIQAALSDSAEYNGSDSTINFAFNLEVFSSRILEEVLLPELENWESLKARVAYDQASGAFETRLLLPRLTYSGIDIDSLGMIARGSDRMFEFRAGLISLSTGPLDIGRTYFDGDWDGDKLDLDFLAFDGEETLIHVAWDLVFQGDTLNIHIDPDELILNKRDWTILPENQITYTDKRIRIQDFELSREDQFFELSNDVEGIEAEHVGISFKNFRLSTFTSLLNPDQLVATGYVNGDFVVENPFGATGLVADVRIDEFYALSTPLGNLAIAAASLDGGGYDFSLALKDGEVDLELFGDYVAAETGAELNLDLDLNELNLSVLQGLLPDQISDSQGSIVGHVDVSGTTVDPVYEGEFTFEAAALTLSMLNSTYQMDDQTLRIDNSGLYLDEFTIRDADENTFVLAGNVSTETLANPIFDLTLNADNFRVFNSTREDNDLFYGTAIIDADVDIEGDLNLPIVQARLNVRSGTEVNFVIPESQLDIVERDGVVMFVNQNDPDEILTRRQEEATTSGITGFQVDAQITADPEASFRIVVDERSGDNLLVAGEADLMLRVDPNGRIDLSGTYELSSGHYEMSLYNLVSRRFEIEEGSSISWSGDPLDASLNMTAIYRVRTSAAELMAAQTAGLGSDVRTQYNQELPFLVYLSIDGDLTRLEPSFRLDMPEEQRGAMGGNVYGQVQMLNNQEGELNRQVFSLLVLNRFFPDRGGDGSGGGTMGLARSSVSQMLSGQLNNLSENVLGDTGVELDFDLDSFTDYQSGAAQDRTQLNVAARSRFMDDRLIVQVGSQIDIEGRSQQMDRGNALLGNVSIEYLLTENGRYRLRGFRRNQFESFIDGQLIVTGMSVIFNREFNEFEELWKGIDNRRKEKSGTRREESDEE